MSGYKIEIRHTISTVARRPMIEVTPFGLIRTDPRNNAYLFDSVAHARRHARKLGKDIGFWVHDFTAMQGDKPTYY